MDSDKLRVAIVNNDWGTTLANQDNFYRMLFKMERKTVLEESDTNEIFASYKNWKGQVDKLVQECNTNGTLEDRKAVAFAETLDDDILKHIENIITSPACKDKQLIAHLLVLAEEASVMEQ